MSKENSSSEIFDIASFFAGVKGQLVDLNKKVIDGSNLKTTDIDVIKVAKEYDQSRGINYTQPQQAPPPHFIKGTDLRKIPSGDWPGNVIPVNNNNSEADENQLLFNFDKKYSLNDVFSKVDEIYRKIVFLENEIVSLKKELLEEKKR